MAVPSINKRLQKIARQYLKGKLNASEQREFDEWFLKDDTNDVPVNIDLTADEHRKQLLSRIHSEAGIAAPGFRATKLWAKIAVAASVLLVLLAGSYVALHKKPVSRQTVQNVQDIAPGGNKAILTLANGEKVELTGAKNGLIAHQGKAAIIKKEDGQLVYSNNQAGLADKEGPLMNTIQTPRGGKYKLVLADGTIVILDAASSIRYPVAFNGDERLVEVTGQAYFEVVHNTTKPFKVMVKGQIVEDLGTKFNINAYDDEPVIKTTLLEGSISLTKGARTVVLKPGEQAVNTMNSTDIKINIADTDEVTAWKNDYFIFNNEALESVMRKISRWYDVDIQYQGGQEIKESYLGSLTRYANVSQVLKMMEITGDVRFEIKGRSIIVYPHVKK